jgi:Flp pilus assembly protein TadD
MPSEQAFALSERAARRAVSVAPNYGAAHAALGRALIIQGKDQYSDEFERAIVLSPDDPEVIREYARYLSDKDTRKALKIFEPLLAREPRDPRLRVAYAGLLDSNGDIDEALAQYRAAIGLDPEYVLPYYRAAGTVYQMVGRKDLAMRLARRATNLDPDNPDLMYEIAGIYWSWGETELFHEAQQALRRMGAKRELQRLEADIAVATSHTEDARSAIKELLADGPDEYALVALTRLRGRAEDYEVALLRVETFLAGHAWARENGGGTDAIVCLNSWIGNQKAAATELARLEPLWRSRHAFGFQPDPRRDFLARSLACVGRNDDALTELEALLNEGYNIGWRDMAVDPAYDAIRHDPRFRAVSDKLKAADAAAKARFRARPDLNDADIDSLGT